MVRKKLLRSAVIIPLVLIIGALGGPAYASPLAATTARAYGINLDLLDANVISPTPNVQAGPGINQGADNLVEVPLEEVAFAGVVGAKAVTRRDAVLDPELPAQFLQVTQGGPARPALYNAQAYARTAGAVALPESLGLDDPLNAVRSVLGTSDILAVDGVSAEALVSCVEGAPVLVGGALLTGVELLGLDLTDTLDGTVNQVVDLANTPLGLLGGSLIANEQVRTPNSLSVNALHLTIPGVIDVVISHAEVTGVACEPLDVPDCRDAIDNDGDGKIDFNPPPGAQRDPGCENPDDDSEVNILPRTGGNNALLGASILAGGLLLLAVQRRRKASL